MYRSVSCALRSVKRQRMETRWSSCAMPGVRILSSSSGCPTRMIWTSFSWAVSRFDNTRICSRNSVDRCCASSKMATQLFARCVRRSRDAELAEERGEHLVRVEERIEDQRRLNRVLVEFFDQVTAKCRLPRARLTGDEHEAFAIIDTV